MAELKEIPATIKEAETIVVPAYIEYPKERYNLKVALKRNDVVEIPIIVNGVEEYRSKIVITYPAPVGQILQGLLVWDTVPMNPPPEKEADATTAEEAVDIAAELIKIKEPIIEEPAEIKG